MEKIITQQIGKHLRAGPFDRWPTGLGFDYFYGFNAGETHQYYPVIFENTVPVEPDKTPEQGYHFMTDMTDRAIKWIQLQKTMQPDRPVFMYFAPGASTCSASCS
ncbi:sulfatase-like hydrolase/transferase [Flavobacterium sp. P21]|uniref:sulfatase-like hydrolase/transferase n=1 Tax=Flavobacterium sp. P21 TaxID=3423948 RepID=UPI003D677C9A